MSEENKDVVTFEYENGDTYLGEVNENGEPHGRGVLKSKDNFVTTNGWFKNGLLHGEATISKGYNKENEDETRKEKRTGDFVDGLMHGTHTYEAHREGKFRKFIQEFDKDNLIHTTNEDGTQEFYLEEIHHYDLMFSENIIQKNIKEISFLTDTVIDSIEKLNEKLNRFSSLELIFYTYLDWHHHKEKITSLYNSKNFDSNCLPSIWFQEQQIKNREDVSSVNAFIKYFITQVYRSFALSKVINFEDNLNDFSINFYDHSAENYIQDFNFWHNVHVSQEDLEKMKTLTAEEHEKLCAELLKNYSVHKWMTLDNEYDIHITVENKN